MIGVTGASGHLGRLVVEDLLERGVPAGRVVAVARSPERIRELGERGVVVRRADYDEPAGLPAALEGVERLLFVSGSEVGRRLPQHRNVVEAARAAGVDLLVYTSVLKADAGGTIIAAEHAGTEEAIRASGLPFVFLRNGWYLENYTENLAPALQHGTLLGCADGGRVSAAARADYAAAAGVVLTGDGHEGAAYELGGDDAFTMSELAEVVSRESGRPVQYRDLPEAEYEAALLGFGLPAPVARMLADSDSGVARGEIFTESRDLPRLIGRPTTPLRDAVAAALRG